MPQLRQRSTIWLVGLLGSIILLSSGCQAPTTQGHPASSGSPALSDPLQPVPPPPPPPDTRITVVTSGDVLPHLPVISSATTAQGIDFTPLWDSLTPHIAGADLALCHLEVPTSPPGQQPSGYPRFGAPSELVRDLAEQGWDGCSTASNHALDRGQAGITATINALRSESMGWAGTAETHSDQQAQLYDFTVGDKTVRIAHISGTFGTNGLPIPPDAPWAVNLLDPTALIEQATSARTAGAQIVLASIHAGQEYRVPATEQQEQLVTTLAESGVIDAVIGHHAHVPQAMTLIPGGPYGQGMWVMYGLGNYISNQSAECCSPLSPIGILGKISIMVPGSGAAPYLEEVSWQAITTDRQGGHQLYDISTPDGKPHGTLSAAEIDQRLGAAKEAVGDEAPLTSELPSPGADAMRVIPRSSP